MKGFMVMLLICSVTMSAAALFYMAATPLLAKHYSESPLLFMACHYYRAYHSLPAEIRQCPC